MALIVEEPATERILTRLREGGLFYVGAPTLVEIKLVLADRFGRDADRDVDQLSRSIGFTIIPFTQTHSDAAFAAWRRYGKGRHKASLNLGDCMSYAIAKVARAELVYVGDDFSQTDLA